MDGSDTLSTDTNRTDQAERSETLPPAEHCANQVIQRTFCPNGDVVLRMMDVRAAGHRTHRSVIRISKRGEYDADGITGAAADSIRELLEKHLQQRSVRLISGPNGLKRFKNRRS